MLIADSTQLKDLITRPMFVRFIFCLYCLLSVAAAKGQQGFFLDDWQPKSIVSPPFTVVEKPVGEPDATITIDKSAIISKVPRSLFGNNANPYMTQIITEPVLLSHIKSLSPNIIRFPGGNISSVFFWNADNNKPPVNAPDSLFDSNGKTVKAGYWFGNNQESWTLSTANYYKMLERTNSTGIITANYSYARYGLGEDPVADAAHLAAEWVRYDKGRTKYWEIGNEDAGPWQAGYKINTETNRDGQPQIITGKVYGKHFRVFADSMKKAASETGAQIYIGAQLIHYDAAGSWNITDRTWNSGFFAEAGNEADFFILHSYYTPFAENTHADKILESAAAETKSMMDWMKVTTDRAGVQTKPIALTEWNIFAEGSRQSVSHINGLHATLVLGELIKNKYGLACRWDLANGWSNGNDHGMFSMGDEPGNVPKWNPRPVFYHMYFFQQYMGDHMVKSEVSGNNNIVSYASTFSSGQTGVIIVNKGSSSGLVKINALSTGVKRYYWYTLTGSDDNGEFSGKVLINGEGPDSRNGGPSDYGSIPASSIEGGGDIKLAVPPRSAIYMLLEPGEITAIRDIDTLNKIVKVFPNPSKGGNFTVGFQQYNFSFKAIIRLFNQSGQMIGQYNYTNPINVDFNQPLPPGIYKLMVSMKEGITIKSIVVH